MDSTVALKLLRCLSARLRPPGVGAFVASSARSAPFLWKLISGRPRLPSWAGRGAKPPPPIEPAVEVASETEPFRRVGPPFVFFPRRVRGRGARVPHPPFSSPDGYVAAGPVSPVRAHEADAQCLWIGAVVQATAASPSIAAQRCAPKFETCPPKLTRVSRIRAPMFTVPR